MVRGTGDGVYEPAASVTRAQMATFLVRAYELASGNQLGGAGEDLFEDDDGSVHEGRIDKAADAGFTTGTAPGRFAPADHVRRDQMASFLARVVDLLVQDGVVAP